MYHIIVLGWVFFFKYGGSRGQIFFRVWFQPTWHAPEPPHNCPAHLLVPLLYSPALVQVTGFSNGGSPLSALVSLSLQPVGVGYGVADFLFLFDLFVYVYYVVVRLVFPLCCVCNFVLRRCTMIQRLKMYCPNCHDSIMNQVNKISICYYGGKFLLTSKNPNVVKNTNANIDQIKRKME